jgi:hypothetical protein
MSGMPGEGGSRGPASSPAEGLRLALELTELGLDLRLQRFRREHPDATEAEVEAVARAWLLDRPGAPLGDAPGRPSTRLRPS